MKVFLLHSITFLYFFLNMYNLSISMKLTSKIMLSGDEVHKYLFPYMKKQDHYIQTHYKAKF